jgi:hypothetical protein
MFQFLTSDFYIIYSVAGFGAAVFGYASGRFFRHGKIRLDVLLWVGIAALLVDNISSLGRHLDWKLMQDLRNAIVLLVPAAVAYPIARVIRYRLKGFTAQVFHGFVALGSAYAFVMLFVSSGTIYYFPWGLESHGGMEPHLARIYLTWLSSNPLLFMVLVLGVILFLFLRQRQRPEVLDLRASRAAWMSSVAAYFVTNPVLMATEEGAYVGLSISLYVAIIAVGSVGYWSAMRGLSKIHDQCVLGERRQYVILLVFLLLFGLTVEAQTTFVGGIGGSNIPYLELLVLLGTISLFWGISLGQCGRHDALAGIGKTGVENEPHPEAFRRTSRTDDVFGRVGEVMDSLKALVGCVENAQGALDMRKATLAGILSAAKGALEGRQGPPEAWQAVASDLAAIDRFVSALNKAGEALHSLRFVRYREGDLPPEVRAYVEEGLRALRSAREELPNAWKTAYQTRLVSGLPDIERLVDVADLEARLTECERLARAFLESWQRVAR